MAISASEFFEIVRDVVTNVLLSIFFIVSGALKALTPYSWWPHKNVKDEVVLITGAGGGLGRLLAKEFARLGARLVLWDISESGNRDTAEQCRQCGAAEVRTYRMDLNDRDSTYNAGARTLSDVGKVDILINNGGIMIGKSIFDLKDEEIDRIFRINAISHFWTTKLFLPGMWERNHGHIVGISSAAGLHGAPMLSDYCATKFAINGFYQSMFAKTRFEKKTGVNVTYACPSYMSTGMFQGVTCMVGIPILQPDYVAHVIVEAILTNQYELLIPRFMYILLASKSFMPTEFNAFVSDKFKFYSTMEKFVPQPVEGSGAVAQ